MAEILNDHGYTARQQGKLAESKSHYWSALRMWREIEEKWRKTGQSATSEYANTLNNDSFVLAELGQYDDALRRCLDGLAMRRERGDDGPIALSLNTLGLIEVRNDQPHRGEGHCRQALQTFRDIALQRGIGLACTARAEALRREALTPELYPPAEKSHRLQEAAGLAGEAVKIFSEDAPEPMRLVEAQIELGCDYRDWSSIRGAGMEDELYRRGQEAFRAAVTGAGEEAGFAHKRMDARINWAWLEYSMGHGEAAEELLKKIIQEDTPPGYLIRKDEGLAVDDDESEMPPLFWMHLGKAELLRGRMAMQAFERAEKRSAEADAALRAAAEHFTLALAYDHQFAEMFRDLRRGLEAIYNDLKRLNEREFTAFMAGAESAAGEYLLAEPTHLQEFVKRGFGVGMSASDDPEELDL